MTKKELLGKPVLDLQGRRILGHVRDLAARSDAAAVSGLYVTGTGAGRPMLLAEMESICSLGQEAVFVHRPLIRCARGRISGFDLLRDAQGQLLGRIRDLEFDSDGQILSLMLSPSLTEPQQRVSLRGAALLRDGEGQICLVQEPHNLWTRRP